MSERLFSGDNRVIDLINHLRDLNIEDAGVELPQVVVMGDQSAGKSSVLESISGVSFPRGTGTVTKMATELTMLSTISSTIHGRVQVLVRKTGEIETKWEGEADSIEELGLIVGDHIEQITAEKIDSNNIISEDLIKIELRSNRYYDLTLVDLPGLVHTGDVFEERVKKMTEDYAKKNNTIMLLVCDATKDPDTCEILAIANKHDPAKKRSLPVLTKADRVETNLTEQYCSGWNHSFHDYSHYTLVVNRSAKDIEDEITYDEMKEKEADILETLYGLSDTNSGTLYLMKSLSSLFLKHIQTKLPGMRDKIEKQLKHTNKSILALGASLDSPHQKVRKWNEIVNYIESTLKKLEIVNTFNNPLNQFQDSTQDILSTDYLGLDEYFDIDLSQIEDESTVDSDDLEHINPAITNLIDQVNLHFQSQKKQLSVDVNDIIKILFTDICELLSSDIKTVLQDVKEHVLQSLQREIESIITKYEMYGNLGSTLARICHSCLDENYEHLLDWWDTLLFKHRDHIYSYRKRALSRELSKRKAQHFMQFFANDANPAQKITADRWMSAFDDYENKHGDTAKTLILLSCYKKEQFMVIGEELNKTISKIMVSDLFSSIIDRSSEYEQVDFVLHEPEDIKRRRQKLNDQQKSLDEAHKAIIEYMTTFR